MARLRSQYDQLSFLAGAAPFVLPLLLLGFAFFRRGIVAGTAAASIATAIAALGAWSAWKSLPPTVAARRAFVHLTAIRFLWVFAAVMAGPGSIVLSIIVPGVCYGRATGLIALLVTTVLVATTCTAGAWTLFRWTNENLVPAAQEQLRLAVFTA